MAGLTSVRQKADLLGVQHLAKFQAQASRPEEASRDRKNWDTLLSDPVLLSLSLTLYDPPGTALGLPNSLQTLWDSVAFEANAD